MANDGAVARLAGRFPPGTKVGLYRGHTDTVAAGEAPFKTATVDKDGEVSFSGLDDDERLFIAGYVEETRPLGNRQWATEKRWRSVAIHASVPEPERKPDSEAKIAAALGSTLSPHELEPDRTTVGGRNSKSLTRGGQPFAAKETGHPTPEGAPAERTPHLRQEDARGVEQRSATFTGQATPVDPDEQVPKPAQHKIEDGKLVPSDGIDMEQRSATPLGELTPIPQGEQAPGVPQSLDVDREQRVVGDTGSQFPVPQGDPVEIQRRKESSQAKAEGAVQPPVGDDPEAKKRSEAAKKAARTRKRNERQAARAGTPSTTGARSTGNIDTKGGSK